MKKQQDYVSKSKRLAKRILRLQEEASRVYEKIGPLMDELIARQTMKQGRRSGLFMDLELTHNGELYQLIDNFEGRNVAYRPARVSRFELRRIPTPRKSAKKGLVQG